MSFKKYSIPVIIVASIGILAILGFPTGTNPQLKLFCNYINFDDSSFYPCLVIDTINDNNNIWQVGRPNKNLFKTAFSYPNVIVTDTVNPYPPGDTSSFYLREIIESWGIMADFMGYYRVNSDTISDYGKIEISPDNGTTWVNIIEDTVYSVYIYWYSEKPVLTGNSGGWKFLEFNVYPLLDLFNVAEGDTVLYRFTFVSDSIDNTKDGIMFDNLYSASIIDGFDEKEYDFILSEGFPSFSKDYLNIKITTKEDIPFQLFIFDQLGKNVMQHYIRDNGARINISSLNTGIYYYEMVNYSRKKYSSGKFIK